MNSTRHVAFSVALCTAAVFATCFSLFYVLLSLTQVTTLLDVLVPVSPDSPSNGLRQLLGSFSFSLIGGETPTHLNQSAFAAAALLFALAVLLIYVEEALLRAKEKIRAWGKLPSVEVLHHYNRNSYDVALAKAGKGLAFKKPM